MQADRASFVAGAVTGAALAVSAGTILLATRQITPVSWKNSILSAFSRYNSTAPHTAAPHVVGESSTLQADGPGGWDADAHAAAIVSDEVLAEQLTRNVQFFGVEAQQHVARSFVLVVGLGGVGSHAAHLLLRSGVGRLRLVDFDQVTLSSLNRHAVATRADVGMPKAVCLARHFSAIMPEACVEPIVAMCGADNVQALLEGRPDYVIDAIDNIHTKVELLAACHAADIPVLCVAGAGAKADPTRLRIVDVSESSVDPLARAVRHRLRREHGISGGVPVLLSTEKPRCALVSLVDMEGGNPLDFQVVPNFRVRTIPVLGTAPAIFGMAAAAHVLCKLACAPFEGEPIIKLTAPQYDRALTRLAQREEEVFQWSEVLPVDRDDVVLLLREVYRGLSARAPRTVLPGADKGLMRSTAHLHLTRWDRSRSATVDNLVLLTAEEAAAHDALPGGLDALRQHEPEFVARVERLLDGVRAQVMY